MCASNKVYQRQNKQNSCLLRGGRESQGSDLQLWSVLFSGLKHSRLIRRTDEDCGNPKTKGCICASTFFSRFYTPNCTTIKNVLRDNKTRPRLKSHLLLLSNYRSCSHCKLLCNILFFCVLFMKNLPRYGNEFVGCKSPEQTLETRQVLVPVCAHRTTPDYFLSRLFQTIFTW